MEPPAPSPRFSAKMVITLEPKFSGVIVVDEVQLQPPIPFKSGGFMFPVIPKRPLLIPITVWLNYTDAATGRQTTVQSIATYYYTTPHPYTISHSRNKYPPTTVSTWGLLCHTRTFKGSPGMNTVSPT